MNQIYPKKWGISIDKWKDGIAWELVTSTSADMASYLPIILLTASRAPRYCWRNHFLSASLLFRCQIAFRGLVKMQIPGPHLQRSYFRRSEKVSRWFWSWRSVDYLLRNTIERPKNCFYSWQEAKEIELCSPLQIWALALCNFPRKALSGRQGDEPANPQQHFRICLKCAFRFWKWGSVSMTPSVPLSPLHSFCQGFHSERGST